MAFTRAHLYNSSEQLTSHFARALSHPARIRILAKLFKKGPCTVEELMKLQPISQPSISQHLAILRKSRLVIFTEDCPYTYYNINYDSLRHMKHHMKLFLKDI